MIPSIKQEQIKFEEEITDIVQKYELNYIDAIIHYCEKRGMEVEVAAKLINKNLKAKISLNAQKLNMIEKTRKLI